MSKRKYMRSQVERNKEFFVPKKKSVSYDANYSLNTLTTQQQFGKRVKSSLFVSFANGTSINFFFENK